MNAEEILKKLVYKGSPEGAIINAPDGFEDAFVKAGFQISVSQKTLKHFTILFVNDKADFQKYFKKVVDAVAYDSIFWVVYPKGGSGVKTDVNRDILWKLAEPFGIRPVSQRAVDEIWSAMRFRPIEAVKG